MRGSLGLAVDIEVIIHIEDYRMSVLHGGSHWSLLVGSAGRRSDPMRVIGVRRGSSVPP